jgi:hypothetical protein
MLIIFKRITCRCKGVGWENGALLLPHDCKGNGAIFPGNNGEQDAKEGG